MALARVQFFSISLDGYGTGEGQSHDALFGHAGERLVHEWMFVTRGGARWSASPAAPAASTTPSCGCTIRGRAPRSWGAGFAPPGWHEDPGGRAGGSQPAVPHTDLRPHHHPRPSIEMEGGTTFNFIDASLAEALETAREAADGRDVRIGGVPP